MEKKIATAVVIIVLVVAGFLIVRKNRGKMPDYSNANSSQVVATTSALPVALSVEDIKEGIGSEVKSGDTIVLNYKGTLTDGTQFDSSYERGKPFTTQIGVGQVIKGWDLGVIGMKVGGKRKLTIPPELAYGDRDIGGIGANSTLIFELELLEIK